MTTIDIQLLTQQGDEIGRLVLPDIALSAPGEAGPGPIRPQLGSQMDELNERVMAALAQENMGLTLDPLSTRIAISRALLTLDTADHILIPLVVQEKSRFSDDLPQPHRSPATSENWDDLFPSDVIPLAPHAPDYSNDRRERADEEA